MNNIGAFDAELLDVAWFDPTAVDQGVGWFNYEMPFDHELITPPVSGATEDVFPYDGGGYYPA